MRRGGRGNGGLGVVLYITSYLLCRHGIIMNDIYSYGSHVDMTMI